MGPGDNKYKGKNNKPPGRTHQGNKSDKQGGPVVEQSKSTSDTGQDQLQQYTTPSNKAGKRPLENPSPTNVSPPLTRQKVDDQPPLDLAMFTNMLVDALRDERVSKVLHTYWTQAVQQSVAESNSRIQELEREVEVATNKLAKAQDSIDELEQYSRRNALRIWFPQPEIQGENTDLLVLNYAKKINVDLKPGDIGRSHRVGPPDINRSKPRAVIVKFTTYNTRRVLYEARKTCEDVFVSEDLTQQRSEVFYNARLERRAGRFLHVWTRDGRIYIRRHDSTTKVITTMSDLDGLVDQTPVPPRPQRQGVPATPATNRGDVEPVRNPQTQPTPEASRPSFAEVVQSPPPE